MGCEGQTRTVGVPVGPAPRELAALDRAVAEVDAARSAVLAGPAAVVAAATALDAADEACASGSRSRAREARRSTGAAVLRADGALASSTERLGSYRAALRALVPAAETLEPRQQEALAGLAEAGEREVQAVARFGDAARAAWPAYSALDQAQSTWLERVVAGWYRSQDEAADGYLVLRRPGLPALEQARSRLVQADAGRRPATEGVRAALSAANRALDALR